MTASRDAFLERVRRAVETGNRAGHGTALAARGTIGYQGAGTDPAARFCQELATAGGQAHRVPNTEAAVLRVLELVQSKSAQRVVLGGGALLDALPLRERLRALGLEVLSVATLTAEMARDPLFAADLGISSAHALIAESGTVVLQASREEPRSLSLLPPLHIVLAERAQLVADLFDWFELAQRSEGWSLPSCVSFITGPSKTGDIELRLVTGVHGPGELHVILIEG
jgi:L-lactate utilization protein LutC